MKTLIVTAHPATWGFTHKIAEAYKRADEATGNQVEIMNLYDEVYTQPFFAFEDLKKDCGSTPTKDLIHEKIAWCDELVFVFPIWQLGMPAKMKNFFDTNFNAGFGFKYTAEGLQKLLKGKRARFFLTGDGPDSFYFLYKLILKHITIGGFLYHYCGINIQSVHVFGNMFKKRTDAARAKLIARVEEIATRK